MKTLSEIVEICKSGGKPDGDDARFAICALEALLTFESTTLMRRAIREKKGGKGAFGHNWYFEESFNRNRRAMAKPPIEWLGPSNNPDSPEVQKRIAISKKIFDRVLNKKREHECVDEGYSHCRGCGKQITRPGEKLK